ncbi:hypothetical protein CspeluHIS016_0206840 [Cutaneotrichosporon spelunceum]|uniref:Uncharacterized protein n=1 Tax=Cutaneotrichosporon spelunceum TaxID=1672016 RepID=A0AAD3YB18_9TREE|nr:hypothetical protein CspeluHIS016_0206840 [Cutaneotrichosporon spelunceum]
MDEPERSLRETLASGLGGEATDRVVQSISSRPLWLLKPLPIPAHSVQPRATSLAGMCLNIISVNFDAFRPGDLRLPPLLFRKLMATVYQDRHYSGDTSSTHPDQATMWAFMAIHDPDGAAQWAPSHTIALPPANTVHNLGTSRTRLEDRNHPLVEIPRIFKELHPDKFALLTTLTLDNTVDDAGLQALRWADHLTVLWIRKGMISDDGIRMLAASLELPNWEDGRGCWRLRALYLPGCRLVGDRSMKALARWPGLSVLDVRDTSCTEAALGVVNRFTEDYFEGQPLFQRCTDGLKDLFQVDQEEVLDNLVATLLKPDLPKVDEKEEGEEESSRHQLSLHVVPGPTPAPEHLHDSLCPAWSAELAPAHGGHFVAGGTGTVWGRNAGLVNDYEGEKRRHAVEWALNFQSHEEEVGRARKAGRNAPKSWWEKEREERNNSAREFRDGVKRAHGWKAMAETNHVAGRVYRPKKAEIVAYGEVTGMPDLMMVRLVHPQWWELKYRRAEMVEKTTVRRTAVGLNELAGMLISVDTGSQPTQTQPSQLRPPPTQESARKTPWIARAPPSQSHSQGGKRNPFAAKPVVQSSSGVHKLADTREASRSGHIGSDAAMGKGKRDPLAFLDKGKAKDEEDGRAKQASPPSGRDLLAFVKTTCKDATRSHDKQPQPARSHPKSQPAKSQPARSQPAEPHARQAPSAKKRPASSPASAPPKSKLTKLTDFFAPK